MSIEANKAIARQLERDLLGLMEQRGAVTRRA